MRRLAGALVILICLTGAVPRAVPALAKGGGVDLILGGGDLSPYYYAIPEGWQSDAWASLIPPLAAGGETPATVAPPLNAGALLASSYELYAGPAPELAARTPHARYIPAGDGHPAYLYWEGMSAVWGPPFHLEPGSWVEIPADEAAYLSEALGTALRLKVEQPAFLYTDPIEALVRSGTSYTRLSTAQELPVGPLRRVHDRLSPGYDGWPRLEGVEVTRFVDGYIRTLRAWRQVSAGPVPTDRLYGIPMPDRGGWISYVPGTPSWIFVWPHGPFVEADPALDALLQRTLASVVPGAGTGQGWQVGQTDVIKGIERSRLSNVREVYVGPTRRSGGAAASGDWNGWSHVSGDEAGTLVDAYLESLDSRHPPHPEADDRVPLTAYHVYALDGTWLFAFDPEKPGYPPGLYNQFGGYYDPEPVLTEIMGGAIKSDAMGTSRNLAPAGGPFARDGQGWAVGALILGAAGVLVAGGLLAIRRGARPA